MDASAWNEKYEAADRLWSADPNIFVADRLAVAPPGRGIDLAAGEGRNAVWLDSIGWKMTAVDFSEVAVQRGRAQAPDVEFVVADVATWGPEDQVDLVLIAYLHLARDMFRDVVKRATKWLAPGGELFMIGHDRSNIEHGHGGPQVPEILWDVNELKGWLGDLVLTESVVVRRPVDVGDGYAYARDTLVRARSAAG